MRQFAINCSTLFLVCFTTGCFFLASPQGSQNDQQSKGKASDHFDQILKQFAKEFIRLTPGQNKFPASFDMGAQTEIRNAKPVHKVTFAYSFDVAKYEVTQELYESITGRNPSRWKGARNSVENVDWYEARDFCTKVTAELRKRQLIGPDEEIRLPSEAEWEYACRSGTTTRYSFGDDVSALTHYAWYMENSKGNDPPVGKKRPNPWGLYDMHGYIQEWCEDDWIPNYEGAPLDGSPRRIQGSDKKLLRGGSWAHPAEECQSAFRQFVSAKAKDDKIGFRCVRAKTMHSTEK